jgi:hypothetical protein
MLLNKRDNKIFKGHKPHQKKPKKINQTKKIQIKQHIEKSKIDKFGIKSIQVNM